MKKAKDKKVHALRMLFLSKRKLLRIQEREGVITFPFFISFSDAHL